MTRAPPCGKWSQFEAGYVPAFFRDVSVPLPCAWRCDGDLDGGEQRCRAALDQIEHMLEVFRLAAIGIRDVE